jgi:hypothetical protein
MVGWSEPSIPFIHAITRSVINVKNVINSFHLPTNTSDWYEVPALFTIKMKAMHMKPVKINLFSSFSYA